MFQEENIKMLRRSEKGSLIKEPYPITSTYQLPPSPWDQHLFPVQEMLRTAGLRLESTNTHEKIRCLYQLLDETGTIPGSESMHYPDEKGLRMPGKYITSWTCWHRWINSFLTWESHSKLSRVHKTLCLEELNRTRHSER